MTNKERVKELYPAAICRPNKTGDTPYCIFDHSDIFKIFKSSLTCFGVSYTSEEEAWDHALDYINQRMVYNLEK